MDVKKLRENKELIASKVLDSWWKEKLKQGFHSPCACKSQSSKDAWAQDIRSLGHNEFPKFFKFCDKCHPDMYPYNMLPENIKDYDRDTVETILLAIEEI